MQIVMKTCYPNELPKSLKKDVLNHLKNKTTDNVTTLHWRGYVIDCWTISDKVQYCTDKHFVRGD